MIEYIVPSNVSEILSKESGRQVILKNTYVLERIEEYRYAFDFMIDNFPKLLHVDLKIDRMELGTTVWPEIYQSLLKQIRELPKGDNK